jgi:hypothetical protein
METPSCGQWEIVVLGPPDFLTRGRAFNLTTKALAGQGDLSVESTVIMRARLHLSSGKNKSADCADHADEEKKVLLNFGSTSLEYSRFVYNK